MLERAWASNWERKTKTATDILEKRNNVNTKFSEMAESRTFGYNPPPDSSERTRLLRLKVRDNPKRRCPIFQIFWQPSLPLSSYIASDPKNSFWRRHSKLSEPLSPLAQPFKKVNTCSGQQNISPSNIWFLILDPQTSRGNKKLKYHALAYLATTLCPNLQSIYPSSLWIMSLIILSNKAKCLPTGQVLIAGMP